ADENVMKTISSQNRSKRRAAALKFESETIARPIFVASSIESRGGVHPGVAVILALRFILASQWLWVMLVVVPHSTALAGSNQSTNVWSTACLVVFAYRLPDGILRSRFFRSRCSLLIRRALRRTNLRRLRRRLQRRLIKTPRPEARPVRAPRT